MSTHVVTQDDVFVKCRQDFPILQHNLNGKPIIYLDSGATAQKPMAVLNAINEYYSKKNANVHRGVSALSDVATTAYEHARKTVQSFINAESDKECIFVRGTTEAINLVAQSFLRPRLNPGDEIILTELEHHSNIVPWQLVAEAAGAKIQVVPITQTGDLDLNVYNHLLSEKTKMVALTHVSNVLGTIVSIKDMIAKAHQHNIPVLIDGAQAAPHMPVDVQDLDCDFYAFSGHKLYGPTGIGVLYGKQARLNAMPPYQGGGSMIEQVSFTKTTFAPVPQRFEAGTPNIASSIGLAAAMDYVEQIGWDAIIQHEAELLSYLIEQLNTIPGLTILLQPKQAIGVVSFAIDGVHSHDVGTVLDSCGVVIRAGHHCAMPLMKKLGVTGTARISLGLYNNKADIDALINALQQVQELFG